MLECVLHTLKLHFKIDEPNTLDTKYVSLALLQETLLTLQQKPVAVRETVQCSCCIL